MSQKRRGRKEPSWAAENLLVSQLQSCSLYRPSVCSISQHALSMLFPLGNYLLPFSQVKGWGWYLLISQCGDYFPLLGSLSDNVCIQHFLNASFMNAVRRFYSFWEGKLAQEYYWQLDCHLQLPDVRPHSGHTSLLSKSCLHCQPSGPLELGCRIVKMEPKLGPMLPWYFTRFQSPNLTCRSQANSCRIVY